MAVYFVYRCADAGPTALHRKRFDEATLLDWFRNRWRPFDDYTTANAYLTELLGVKVYSIGDLFFDDDAAEQIRPDTLEAIAAAFSRTYHNAIAFEDHCVQVLTDDDECDMAYYFFDDVFVEKHSDLTAFLLHEGPLPLECGEGGWRSNHPDIEAMTAVLEGDGEGRVYSSLQCPGSSDWHEDMSEFDLDIFDGVRVPDLCRRLLKEPDDEADGLPNPFIAMREALFAKDLVGEGEERAFLDALQTDPNDEVTWRVYGDWLIDRDERVPGVRLLERAIRRTIGEEAEPILRLSDHFVQASLPSGDGDHNQWFAFDDLWASANPVLANAMIRFATRWDALSTGNERRFE